jgi:Fe2+ transport system protein FeoA
VCLEDHSEPEDYPENCHLPLTMVAPGESVKLVRIAAGHRLRRRLTELGLIPGVELKIMQAEGGPLLLAVKDTRLALGRGMAHKIFVEAV